VLADQAPAPPPLIRTRDVRVETMRGRGRGGQRKNKTETAVRIRHLPTGTVITRNTGRSQAANLASARDQLAQALRDSAARGAAELTSRQRRAQMARGPHARVFTHDTRQGLVTDHLTGKSWSLRDWQKGRLDDPGGAAA
jgi:peptide chain release factor 1